MSQFAAALSWVPMSRNLAETMARACDYATQQAHRQVTLEHLLLALSDDADASAVLAVSNVDLGQLGADVANHVSQNGNRFAQTEVVDPAADETLVRILDYAAAAARQSRRREINGAVVLAAIIGDGNSTAATILKAQGLTFEAAIKALQKSNAQPRPAAAVAQPSPAGPAPVRVPEPAAITAAAPVPPAFVDEQVVTEQVVPEPVVVVPADLEPPTISGAATHANETMLANVRRKLEATRAAGPIRPTMAPVAPLAPIATMAPMAPLVPPPVPEPMPVAVVREPVAELSTAAVDESAGLASLVKNGGKTLAPSAAVAAASFDPTGAVANPELPSPQITVTPEASDTGPTLVAAPPPTPVTAGADLARKHEGWLPPSSPTLVTEANKPARRTPPVPPIETRPPPLPPTPPTTTPTMPPREDTHRSSAERDAGPSIGDAGRQVAESRVSQDAGPPRAVSRPPTPAPWPESAPVAAPTPVPPHAYAPPQQPHPRDFQPLPTGGPYPPTQQPSMVRTNGGSPPPGYPQGQGSGLAHGQWPPNQMPAQPGPAQPPNGQRPQQPGAQHPQHQHPPQQGQQQQGQQRPAPTITATVGKLTGTIPTKWGVFREQPVEVRLSSDELRALAQQLDGRGAAYAHERVVAKALSVRLKASNHSFAIEPTSPETLWLDAQTLHMSNDGVHWRWHATPQISGKKKLQLLISARTIGGDGVVAETALPDQSVTVKVGGNPGRFAMKLLGYVALLALGAVLARYGEGGIETLMAWKRGFQ